MKAVAKQSQKSSALEQAHLESWPILAGLFWFVLSPLPVAGQFEGSIFIGSFALSIKALFLALLSFGLSLTLLISHLLLGHSRLVPAHLSGPWASRR